MSKPIAFIIGFGKNIGTGTANALQSKGYRVALAARSLKPENSTPENLHLSIDLSNPDSVSPAFTSLRKQWGEPSVVFYNGMYRQVVNRQYIEPPHLTPMPAAAAHFADDSAPFSHSPSDLATDLAINTTSVYAAIKESLTGFDKLDASIPKAFLYTGNILNTKVMPGLLTLGVGKAASAHIIELADGVYREKKGYQ